ncbi:MAG: hypothetical protein ABL877_10420 [Thiobacillus sp.]
MKATRIALALAALGMTAAHAASLPGLTAAGVPTSNQILVSGASALSASFAGVVTSMCDVAGGGVVTTNSCGSSGVAVRCTKGKTDSGFSGVAFAVSKRDTDGSFAGVGNVISGTPITGWCDAPAGGVGAGVTNTSGAGIAPDAGLTDVDTNVWVGMSNTGALSLPVPAASGVSLNGGFAGQGFGVMASEELYKAMQNVQKADGRLPSTCVTGDFVAGQCQPSISKEEYAAVAVDGNFSYVVPSTVPVVGYVSPLTGDTNPINLCRRVETSGTQATSNVYFLNNSCGNASPTLGAKPPKKVDFSSGTAVTFVNGVSGAVVTGNYDDFGGAFGLFEGSGTGDARNCVIRRNTSKNPNNVVDTLGTYAAGVISLENTPAAGWKLLKIDGVSPNAYQTVLGEPIMIGKATDTDVNGDGVADSVADGWIQDSTHRITTVRGQYDFAPEFEMLWPSASGFATSLNKMKNTFADPAAVSLNGIFQANGVFTHASNPTKVHKGTRSGNFCAPQILAE